MSHKEIFRFDPAVGLVRFVYRTAFALFLAVPLVATAGPATEQAVETDPAQATAARFEDEVTVTATREDRRLSEVPSAVGIVGEDDLASGRKEGLDSYLNAIPGVVAQPNDGGSDVKLSIRGFGARSTFGVRDVLVLVDGVSITDADGFTRLDQIDLAAAERVEVVKGPASAIYGNAAFGGVVNVITRHGVIGESDVRLAFEAGELGFSKGLASIAGGLERRRLAYAVHLSSSRLDGFRDHNETETRRLNASLDAFATERTTIRFLLNMSEMRDEIPGSLNREQFETDPSQVRPIFELFDQRRDDDRYRLGAVVEHQVGADSRLEGRLFVMTRALDHPIFQVIDQDGLRFMGGVRYGRRLTDRQQLTLGFDGDHEDIDNQRFVNAFGEPGALVLSADETVDSFAVYAQDEIALGQHLSLTVGGRFDSIRYTERDRLAADPGLSASRTFERFSPKLALLWSPFPSLSAYFNLSSAFQVPTKSELTATGGNASFNQDLDPQVARHAEIGVRGSVRDRLRYEVSVFHTEVDDEILPRTRINNVTVFGNVGETRHRGLEAAVDVRLGGFFEARVGYGWSDNQFTDFREFAGNTLPGHPEHQGTVRLATRRAEGVNGYLTFQRVGSVFLNDANNETFRPYSLLHAGLDFGWRRFDLEVRMTNLTDESYVAWFAVNDPFGNFFLPATGRAVSASVGVRF